MDINIRFHTCGTLQAWCRTEIIYVEKILEENDGSGALMNSLESHSR